jgi:hypothetical protein
MSSQDEIIATKEYLEKIENHGMLIRAGIQAIWNLQYPECPLTRPIVSAQIAVCANNIGVLQESMDCLVQDIKLLNIIEVYQAQGNTKDESIQKAREHQERLTENVRVLGVVVQNLKKENMDGLRKEVEGKATGDLQR